jgi:xylulokinase
MFDVARRRWSREILDGAQIDPTLLPQAFESADVCGSVSEEGASASGSCKAHPSSPEPVTRPRRNGNRRRAAGVVSATIGTSGVVFAATDRPRWIPRTPSHVLSRSAAPLASHGSDPGGWPFVALAPRSARRARRRLRQHDCGSRTRTRGRRWSALGAVSDGRTNAAPDPMPAPRWLVSSRAIIAAHYSSGARGRRLQPARYADHLRGAQRPVSSIRLGGGGARSALWRQIQADVYGRAVETVLVDEGAAFGAACSPGSARECGAISTKPRTVSSALQSPRLPSPTPSSS